MDIELIKEFAKFILILCLAGVGARFLIAAAREIVNAPLVDEHGNYVIREDKENGK